MSVVWRFSLDPEGNGTRIAESYQLGRPIPLVAERVAGLVFGMKDRPGEMLDGMRTTLERIAAVAESLPADAG